MPNWPHAPSRNFIGGGAYFVTSSTLHKQRLFDSDEKLDLLLDHLLDKTREFGWELRAWAIFQNHYHFVAYNPQAEPDLMKMLSKLHGQSSRDLNRMDGKVGRVVWYRSWPLKLTYERSYYARMGYVMHNPVKHGIVRAANLYRWCSAGWFEAQADRVLYETVRSFKFDAISIDDDY